MTSAAVPTTARGSRICQSPSDTVESAMESLNRFIAGEPMNPATNTLPGLR
ncbi:Uncharacterised protein [Mycobacterium tuberculosis]|nr:Uncharacterised protein [Mycobacterium tuberculosis]CFS10472.1 Uncharacterised protein [Mycobacterium tuberculosis]CFS38312.1 Uncharacterised protein [Mycobacterium tuberculosis]COX10334.1 Uncharacterised protein [Mycobacterium tuberculosis]